ncbi:MAG: hypothetical protein R3253_09835, partial [Longimicrobiales bacterium]|nr:hypothetical protein [Longimicrobiales bacterium]
MPDRPDALTRIEAYFAAALERPRAEWPALLEGEILDTEIREEVRSLLEAHVADGALDEVAAALARVGRRDEATVAQPDRPLPDRIGPYRVEEALGEGGMASVYRGRLREDPTA